LVCALKKLGAEARSTCVLEFLTIEFRCPGAIGLPWGQESRCSSFVQSNSAVDVGDVASLRNASALISIK
jgi:hypothetical protein